MEAVVVDPETLRALTLALRSTSANTEQSARDALHRARAVVGEISTAVAARETVVARCQAALESCLAAERGSCSREAAELATAEQRLNAGRTAFRAARSALTDHESRSAELLARLEQVHGVGERFLSHKLDRVRAVDAGGGVSVGAGIAAGSTVTSGPRALSTPFELPGLPAGCVMVPLSLIDQTDDPIRGPEDFTKGYSVQDLDYAFDLLENVVLPALMKGGDPSAFAALDQVNGIQGTRSLASTYTGFLSARGDAIRLEQRPDGRFGIANGRHRIWVATLGNRAAVPAYIVGVAP